MSAHTVMTHALTQGTPATPMQGVSLGKATDDTLAHNPGAAVTRSAWMLTTNDLDSFACWLSITGGAA